MLYSIQSFCNCEESSYMPPDDYDSFPSTDQIWGMVGVMLATVLSWVLYKIKLARPRQKTEAGVVPFTKSYISVENKSTLT